MTPQKAARGVNPVVRRIEYLATEQCPVGKEVATIGEPSGSSSDYDLPTNQPPGSCHKKEVEALSNLTGIPILE